MNYILSQVVNLLRRAVVNLNRHEVVRFNRREVVNLTGACTIYPSQHFFRMQRRASVRKEKGAEQFYVAGRARNLNPTVRGAFAQQIARTDSTANSNAQIQQKENTNETAH